MASLNLGKERWSAVAWRVEMFMEITNFVKIVRQILGGTTLFKHLNIKTALKNVTQTLKGN